MERGLEISATNNADGTLNLFIEPEKNYSDIERVMSKREKDLMWYLWENADRRGSITEEVVQNAIIDGYSRKEVEDICAKLESLDMMNNLTPFMEGFWYDWSAMSSFVMNI